MNKPFSAACERNREPILAVLRERFANARSVLEVGSGTGQHAVHFAAALPHLSWQTSDLAANLPGIRSWLGEAALPNTPPPFELDVSRPFPVGPFDAVFTANTLHIMGWTQVEQLFAHLPAAMAPAGLLTVYGPFNYGGQFTSASNAMFDRGLRSGHPECGLRDFEAVAALAHAAGLQLVDDVAMPANNRCITWSRSQ